ncbi:MAG TPA: 3' terminal RNA ribose 2'-O-methyltransferase Hen1 [Gemmatimonadaceae bacterium]
MLLTISTTHNPATDLGYLLHKNPARVQSFDLTFGRGHVFYPEASAERCTAALLLDIDAVHLVRGRQHGGDSGPLGQYVNDRPYVASSFLSVAISSVFRSAMGGRSTERAELANTPIPIEARIAVVRCRGGEPFLRRLLEPLGYTVTVEHHELVGPLPNIRTAVYFTVTLAGTKRVAEVLSHLYVLIPVLDDEKHYWVGDDEVEKLLRVGEGWLAAHPEREMIAQRYLKHRHSLVRDAIARLIADDDSADDETAPAARDAEEAGLERPISLHEQRLTAVLAALRTSGATSVVDFGCGEGKLLRLLLDDTQFTRIVGMDVSHRALEAAADRMRLERMPEKRRARIELLHGSLTYRDARLAGFDGAAVVEVIEHLDAPRLSAFERVVFQFARPRTIVLTTPNAEYNVRWPTLPAGRFRHRDHRFEWTRAQFQEWSASVGERFGYDAVFEAVGPVDPEVGPPTQMVVFTRQDVDG